MKLEYILRIVSYIFVKNCLIFKLIFSLSTFVLYLTMFSSYKKRAMSSLTLIFFQVIILYAIFFQVWIHCNFLAIAHINFWNVNLASNQFKNPQVSNTFSQVKEGLLLALHLGFIKRPKLV
jgi:hypothetical protein